MGKIWIGISGWSYDSWRGDFYPADLPRSRQLEYASRRFRSIEINGSFYGLLTPGTYGGWRERTPTGFLFAVKGSRFITHNKSLRDIEVPLANFFASGVLRLEEKLGPILWQLSSRTTYDAERIARFLDILPHDTRSAARLSRLHDERLKVKPHTTVDVNRRLRHAIEVRNESFFTPGFARIARDSGTAIAFSDSASWPYTEEVTAGFVYLRLHGHEETYASGYDASALDRWADRIRAWHRAAEPPDAERFTGLRPPPRKSRDVYAYFDNDARGRAPYDARGLAERLGVAPEAPADEGAGG